MNLYDLSCHMELCSVIEAAQHMVDYGCIVESEPKVTA